MLYGPSMSSLYGGLFMLALAGITVEQAAKESDAVHEAAIRYFLDNGIPCYLHVACLDIDGKDPTDEFMARLSGVARPIRRRSECHWQTMGGVWTSTGERGALVGSGALRWKSRTKVEATAGYWSSGLDSRSHAYTLRKEKGKWRVVKDKAGPPS